MDEGFVDRRQSPRIPVRGRAHLERATALHVRLIDVSLGGVLLSSSQPLKEGQCARLNARLGDVPVVADVEVRHSSREGADGGPFWVRARFLALDQVTREAMRAFLASANR